MKLSSNNVWDVMKDVTSFKERIITRENENDYNPYMMNRIFSNSSETIFISNEMNRYSHLDNLLQYEFYFNFLKKKKRYIPWVKNSISPEQEAVAVYYNYSLEKAKKVLPLLKSEQLETIKKYAENMKQINT